ncbi:MAG: HAD family hydrolase [Planctomycetota bacterium]
MDPTAIIFDLDGTLVDRGAAFRPYAEKFHAAFRGRLGEIEVGALRDRLVEADGKGYRPKPELAVRLLEALPWRSLPTADELESFRRAEFPKLVAARDGAAELLAWLSERGYRLGVVTNGSVRSQTTKLHVARLIGYFEAVVISGGIGIKKPEAGAFHACLGELGVAAERAWYVGDHPINDVVGSRDAGMTPVWLKGDHDWPDGHARPELIIEHLAELRSHLGPM